MPDSITSSTPNNRLALRYNVEDSRNSGELVGQTLDGGGIGTPSGGRDLFIRDQSLVGTLDSVLKPNLVNTALVQYARRHYNFPGMTGQPDFSVLNDLELGHNFGTNDQLYETRVQFADSISWVKGNHVAKFGFDGNKIWSTVNFPGFMPMRMLIPGMSCIANFAEFYNGPFGSNSAFAYLGRVSTRRPAQCAVPGDNGVVFDYAGCVAPDESQRLAHRLAPRRSLQPITPSIPQPGRMRFRRPCLRATAARLTMGIGAGLLRTNGGSRPS